MRPEYNYRLNCGQYVLHHGDQPVGPLLDEVALCIDLSAEGGLLKHGSPDKVHAYANEARAKLRKAVPEWADALIVFSGRLPLEDLNKCLTTTGYAGVLYRRACEGKLLPQPLA